jgi:hypothetical protein
MATWFRDVTVADDEDLGKTILEIEVRGKRGIGYCKSMPGALRPLERLRSRASPGAHLWLEHAREIVRDHACNRDKRQRNQYI